jgi:hypothetical protein
MQNKKNHIDRIFGGKLRNYKQEPPSDVWDHVREELDLGRKRKRFAWMMAAAASVVVMTVLSLSYLLTRDADEMRVLTDKQISVDSVQEEIKQGIPADAERKDQEEERITHAEMMDEKKTYEVEKHMMEEENDLLTEVDQPVGKEESGSEASEQDEGIAGLSRPETELWHINMNYISQIDYQIYQRERKPVRSSELPVYESQAGSEWDKLYVQEIPPERNEIDNKWSIGTQLSPLFSYRNLGMEESASYSVSNYDQIESGMIAYAGGVNVNYLPTRRLSIQSGIYYSKLGLSVDHDYYYENLAPAGMSYAYKFNSVSNSSGTIDVVNNGRFDYATNSGDTWYYGISTFGNIRELNVRILGGEIIQNFEYLEVPMILRYKLIDRKLGFNLLGGMSTNFLVGNDVYFQEDGTKEKVGKTTDIKTVNYSSIIGFGIDYAISKRLNINFEPTFRYYLNSINISSSIHSHPYSMGIFTGISYYF